MGAFPAPDTSQGLAHAPIVCSRAQGRLAAVHFAQGGTSSALFGLLSPLA